jgi:hypothetical protein
MPSATVLRYLWPLPDRVFRQFVARIAFIAHRSEISEIDRIERINTLRKEVVIGIASCVVRTLDVAVTAIWAFSLRIIFDESFIVSIDVPYTLCHRLETKYFRKKPLTNLLEACSDCALIGTEHNRTHLSDPFSVTPPFLAVAQKKGCGKAVSTLGCFRH